MLNLRNLFHRNETLQPSRSDSRVVGRGKMLADAIARPKLPADAEAWARSIEKHRTELLASSEMLGAWERPWLATSAELRERLKLAEADDRYETAITLGKACEASKPEKWCRALLALVLAAKPESVIEMGTNVGISGLYIAAGLKVNGRGALLTMEGAPSKAVVAASSFNRLDVPAEVIVGDFADTLAPTLARAGRVDLAFIDGFHEGAATLQYHRAFKRVAAPDAILVYDDIDWSDGMREAWRGIGSDPDVAWVLDYRAIGVVGLKG